MSRGFVIDASVIADALGVQDVRGNVAREFLVDHSLFSAPDILIAETYNTLRRMWLRNLFTVQRFAKSISSLVSLPVELTRSEELILSAFDMRSNVSAKDSFYVALARGLDWPLVTMDSRLARVPNLPCDVVSLLPNHSQ